MDTPIEKIKLGFKLGKVKIAMKPGYVAPLKPKTDVIQVGGHRQVYGDLTLCDSLDSQEWERVYQLVMDPKYKKQTRGYSRKIQGHVYQHGQPPIYLIPRQRGGSSYKKLDLVGSDATDLQYACVSKGYGMQDVSSFTLGPVVGEGLCVVNSAFSKIITIGHIEGNGVVDVSRKCFWKRSSSPKYSILPIDTNYMMVDGQQVKITDWLKQHESEWLSSWDQWRRHVALCSLGDFHWDGDVPIVSYRYKDRYLSFVEWKKQCYITPAYKLIPETSVYKFLKEVWSVHKIPLGLVHPMAQSHESEHPITHKYLRELYDSSVEMTCMPYCLAGFLLDVKID